MRNTITLIFVFFCLYTPAIADTIEYDLIIATEEINLTGKPSRAMTLNGMIPGPVLRFTEGDFARIRVHNKMNVDTSIHWHGILVPPDMDGVPYISFPPIAPGTTFAYEFPIRQSGTYWYHSHTSLQEQSGIYGAIVIKPKQDRIKVDRDYVVLLSDWTNEDPHQVLRTLKRGSEWYALQKGSGQSILGAARLGFLGDYFNRELQRMPPMDIADVAYDRFLANGKSESSLFAKPGEIVRLRVIDGSATSYFHLEFAGGSMKIIAADGQDVMPVEQKRFLIGVAETYDVLIQVPLKGAYEFRATAHDGSGYATVWIGTGQPQPSPDVPKPNLYHGHGMGSTDVGRIFALTPTGSMGMPDYMVKAGMFDRPGMGEMGNMQDLQSMPHDANTSGMKMGSMGHAHDIDKDAPHATMPIKPADPAGHPMAHEDHKTETASQETRSGKKYGSNFHILGTDVSSSGKLAMDGMDASRPWPPYEKLWALKSTAFSKDKPVREIRLTLDGDMERYVWLLNNKPLSETDSIRIREGEIARFIMINRTMMHHPMHLHGHFFRVLNGRGDHAPLKHTVDVAPMSTTVIEFEANEVGDWFFHCHLLYHMKSGMARLIHYEDFSLDPKLLPIRQNLYKDPWYFFGQADGLTNMTEGHLRLSNTRNIFNAEWEVGWQEVDDTEWETILTWDRYFNRFFTILVGVDVLGESGVSDHTRGVFGLSYLLPLNFESRAWIDTDSGARIYLEKSFQLTPRLELLGEVQYDTHEQWEGSVDLLYTLTKNISLVGKWHSDFRWGGGIQIRF